MIKSLLNFLIRKIKGETYQIDQYVPLSYLLNLIYRRSIMLLRGVLKFPGRPLIFIGTGSKIRCTSKIKFGKGTSIGENCLLDGMSVNGIVFGNNVSLGTNSRIECSGSLRQIGKGIKVGNNVGLGTDCFYGAAGGITIGDETIFGNFVSMHAENHNFEDLNTPIRLQGVNRQGIEIGKNCWIGAKVTILDGVTIEDGCIISAGALLTKGTYKKNGIYGGVPAKLIKQRS